ncbi:MAG TPA: ferrochelatase [Iamia sp.]|nr:ferrochelatase [Iamia sp.]
MTERVGVVVMAYGTPATPDDVEAYYTHIRRGRPPAPEQLADLQRRYDALGGTSSMAARTAAQVDAIAAALEERAPGRFRVLLGQKHAAPFVEDAAAALAAEGVTDVVGLVLAPHYSGFSVGEYQKRLATAVGRAVSIDRWSDLPEWLDFTAAAVLAARAELPEKTKVLFTAHSLPERVLVGDPYPAELATSARAIARRSGLAPWAGWGLAWQSAGATPEPWRGPDVLQVIRDLADTGRSEGVLVCAQGFVTDHLEVGYDLDIEARAVADEVGLVFGRTRTVDDDTVVMGALADRVVAAAGLGER